MSETMTTLSRDSRQRDLLPPDRLSQIHAVVVGVGAIGRQVAIQLAAIGVPMMTLYDHDTVAVENLGPQGFFADQVGRAKVNAVGEVCHQQFPQLDLVEHAERFKRTEPKWWTTDRLYAIFCCVDSMESRKLIWESVRNRAAFFVDGRMAAETMRVLATQMPLIDQYYSKTLFGSEEAYVGACTSKSTIYSASIAAGLMVGQFARFLREQSVVADQTLNLLAAELTVVDG